MLSKSKVSASQRQPTKAGYYWFCGGNRTVWEVVRLVFLGSEMIVCDTMDGSTVIVKLKDWPAGAWRSCKLPSRI